MILVQSFCSFSIEEAMKLLFCLLVSCLILALVSCSNQSKVNLEEEREQVMTLLDNFVNAHVEKNLDLLLSCFSDKTDIF